MKRILAVILITVSTAAFAGRPEGCNENANINSAVACIENPLAEEEFATVPSPGTFALMALGLTGMMISWRNRK
jgi:hypothetical protein